MEVPLLRACVAALRANSPVLGGVGYLIPTGAGLVGAEETAQ